jgi:hypothetical protein
MKSKTTLTIETLKTKYLDLIKELHPELDQDELWSFVKGYFKHFKSRVETTDKLEYRFLNLGTVATSNKKLKEVVNSNRRKIKGFNDLSPKIKVLNKNVERNLEEQEKYLEYSNTLLTRGRTFKTRKK